MYTTLDGLFKLFIVSILIITLLFSCKQNSSSLTNSQILSAKNSVLKLAKSTSRDISAKGPIAWLDYFEDSPDFFIASEGNLVFPDHQTAKSFIKTKLVKQLRKINLQWFNIRVDPLTSQIATMAANFHEELTNASGKTITDDGYFTATVMETTKGWKYRNAHWSIKAVK